MADIEKVVREIAERNLGQLTKRPFVLADCERAIREAIANPAIRAHILQSAWRPIGEAPKDGSTIIVRAGNWVVTAHWHRSQQCWATCGPTYERLPADEQPTDWHALPPTGGEHG